MTGNLALEFSLRLGLNSPVCCVVLQRAEYDSANNGIDLHLHLSCCYKFHNGALHPSLSWKESVVDLTIDRRKTLGDLRCAVFQVRALSNKLHFHLSHCNLYKYIYAAVPVSRRNFQQQMEFRRLKT